MKLLCMLTVTLRGSGMIHTRIKPRNGLCGRTWQPVRKAIRHIGAREYTRSTLSLGRWSLAQQQYYKCTVYRENWNTLQLTKNFAKDSTWKDDSDSIHLLIKAGYRPSEILHDDYISELSMEQIQYYLKLIHRIGRNVYPSPKLIMFIHDSYGKGELTKEEQLEIEEADTELKITLVEGILQCSREDVEKMKYAPVRKKSSIPYFLKKVDFLLANNMSLNQIRKGDKLFATSLKKLQDRLGLIKSVHHEFSAEECMKILTMSNINFMSKLSSLRKTNDKLSLKYGSKMHKYKILAQHLNVSYSKTFVEKILLLEKMNFSEEELEDMDRRLLTVDKSLLPLVIENLRSEGITGNVISTVYSHRILKFVQEIRENRIYSKSIAKLLKIDNTKLKEVGVHSLSPKLHVIENVRFIKSVGFSSDDMLKCIPLLCVCPHRLKSFYDEMIITGDITVTDQRTHNSEILNVLLYKLLRENNYIIQQNDKDQNDNAVDHVVHEEC